MTNKTKNKFSREVRGRADEGTRAGESRILPGQRDFARGIGSFRTGGVSQKLWAPVQEMIGFIEEQREDYGVEPICWALPIAPSTYHDHVAKRRNPALAAPRVRRDIALQVEVDRVFSENIKV